MIRGSSRVRHGGLAVLLGLGLLAAACASPEATRTRGGGPGADVGNHATSINLHGSGPGGMFYETPTRGQAVRVSRG